jgi:predicted RNA-binding protein YlxR (DUF448 family)
MPKHMPIRTCLGCGQRRSQGTLMRITIKDGQLVADTQLKFQGRGAYVCPSPNCMTLLLKKRGRLAHALRSAMPRDEEAIFLQALAPVTGNEVKD